MVILLSGAIGSAGVAPQSIQVGAQNLAVSAINAHGGTEQNLTNTYGRYIGYTKGSNAFSKLVVKRYNMRSWGEKRRNQLAQPVTTVCSR